MENEKKKLIQFKNVQKSFDDQIILKGIDLDINENEFVTLLGPSGCGKTTLLRILGGFLEADEGEVLIDGKDISGLPPYKRELNTVFQKYALFPNMNVYENIAFGLRIKKVPNDIIEQKVMRMLRLIGLEGYEKREITQLSGGQQQRVAIARALVKNPSLLLCDEPTGALDYVTGKQVLKVLQDECREKGTTVIVITHNLALTPMGDKVIKVRSGKIESITTNEHPMNVEDIEY